MVEGGSGVKEGGSVWMEDLVQVGRTYGLDLQQLQEEEVAGEEEGEGEALHLKALRAYCLLWEMAEQVWGVWDWSEEMLSWLEVALKEIGIKALVGSHHFLFPHQESAVWPGNTGQESGGRYLPTPPQGHHGQTAPTSAGTTAWMSIPGGQTYRGVQPDT